jgi:hypothetical protein
LGSPRTTDTTYHATTIVYALALSLYAIWFGIAAYLVIAPCYDKLSAPTFIEWFQKIDPYMKVRARQLSVGQLLLTISLIGLTLDRSSSLAFWLTVAALVSSTVARGDRRPRQRPPEPSDGPMVTRGAAGRLGAGARSMAPLPQPARRGRDRGFPRDAGGHPPLREWRLRKRGSMRAGSLQPASQRADAAGEHRALRREW